MINFNDINEFDSDLDLTKLINYISKDDFHRLGLVINRVDLSYILDEFKKLFRVESYGEIDTTEDILYLSAVREGVVYIDNSKDSSVDEVLYINDVLDYTKDNIGVYKDKHESVWGEEDIEWGDETGEYTTDDFDADNLMDDDFYWSDNDEDKTNDRL